MWYIYVSYICSVIIKQLEIMRNLFETGKMTEATFYPETENGKGQVRVTMTSNKCFDIRQFDKTTNYFHGCFETSSTSDWNEVKRYVNSLLK